MASLRTQAPIPEEKMSDIEKQWLAAAEAGECVGYQSKSPQALPCRIPEMSSNMVCCHHDQSCPPSWMTSGTIQFATSCNSCVRGAAREVVLVRCGYRCESLPQPGAQRRPLSVNATW
ncbi:hypothetical protein HMPREF9622_01281 [Cutibacterium modestum HL037PA3]|nr:hypothetical protein HMPREF9622_01281 [Cutibacterium modestum HL037PA3]